MRRCETLVATREDLTKMRDRIKATISEEEEALANFKEEQNERILELRYILPLINNCAVQFNSKSMHFKMMSSFMANCFTVPNKMSYRKIIMPWKLSEQNFNE